MSKFVSPLPDLQISFYKRLDELRGTFFLQALLKAASELEIPRLDDELANYVSSSHLRKVASWGLRAELLFPVPYLLAHRPQLLGYYRLLLGFSQKEFYGSNYGYGKFKSMEEKGSLNKVCLTLLPELCRSLCKSSDHLLSSIGPLNKSSLHEMTLLTFGAQLRGGLLNKYGQQATKEVFELIKSICKRTEVTSTQRSLTFINAAGRKVVVEFANDPDICIRETLPSRGKRNIVAIEIKGGRDVSNIHNRIGEAEKSHQKARKEGFVECWTIVGVLKLDMAKAAKESPSTDKFFTLAKIIKPSTLEAREFKEDLLSRINIKD